MSLSQAERLRSLIEEDILSLKLRPGDKLDESRLAGRYGTSRTPVREALRQLAANGLVELRPHKGAVVAKLQTRELLELLEVMAELEGACGRLAAKACFRADLDAIEEALESCRTLAASRDWAHYHVANEAFHEAIYKASHNTTLARLTINVRNRIGTFRRLQLGQFNRLDRSVAEHDHIFSAIREGQCEEADRLLQVHVLSLGTEMHQIVAALGVQVEPGAESVQFGHSEMGHHIPVK